ncbi:MAG: 50S ribosomal protein L29 [Phycisphaeraceae bacterium]|nr:50S ribosomal protein L29 [Phycisphaeraceae bacterium]
MKMEEVRKLSDEEMRVEEQRLRKQLYDLRAQAVTEAVEGTHRFGQIRKDIARILTEKRDRRAAKSVTA